jgi:hypothetical protein
LAAGCLVDPIWIFATDLRHRTVSERGRAAEERPSVTCRLHSLQKVVGGRASMDSFRSGTLLKIRALRFFCGERAEREQREREGEQRRAERGRERAVRRGGGGQIESVTCL